MMKNARFDWTTLVMVIAVALAAATIAAFCWFGTTAGIALAVATAVATVISVVMYGVNVQRNRDEQTRKSTYHLNWFAFVVVAIAAAAVVFMVAIFFAPINNLWMIAPGTALAVVALVIAARKNKKAVALAALIVVLILGTNVVNYAIMKGDNTIGGTGEQNIYNAPVVQHADNVTPTGDVFVENAVNLNAENVKADTLNITEAKVEKVEATEVNITEAKIEKVEATEVNITNAHIEELNATKVDIENATIENINATEVVIENATVAPTKPAPQPTKPAPETTKPAPETTKPAPETTKPAKNPTIKISSTIIEEGGRIIVTLKDAEASDVWFAYTGENGRTSEGLSLRHIAGNQYDIVVNSSLYEYSKSVNIGVNGGNICSFVIQAE